MRIIPPYFHILSIHYKIWKPTKQTSSIVCLKKCHAVFPVPPHDVSLGDFTGPYRVVDCGNKRLAVGRDETPLPVLTGKVSEPVHRRQSVDMHIETCVFFELAEPIRPNRVPHDQRVVAGRDEYIAAPVDYALFSLLVTVEVEIATLRHCARIPNTEHKIKKAAIDRFIAKTFVQRYE